MRRPATGLCDVRPFQVIVEAPPWARAVGNKCLRARVLLAKARGGPEPSDIRRSRTKVSERKGLDLRRRLPVVALAALAALAIPAGAALFVYSGVYDIGADAPHTKPVFWLIGQLRDRSVAAHARGVTPPPDLADPKRIAAGAALYADLCTSCHLAPGMHRTDLSRGLYPQAPQLSYGTDLSPVEQFWVIKHGVKLTAMPAWGRTHRDEEVWDVVAFLKKLPDLDPPGYDAAVKSSQVANLK
jgi:mono/diheme cytochrome c family protein